MKTMEIWGHLEVPDDMTEREVMSRFVTLCVEVAPDWSFTGIVTEVKEEEDVISTGDGEKSGDM